MPNYMIFMILFMLQIIIQASKNRNQSYFTITNINYVISELSNSLSEKDIIEELTWKIETINKLDMLIEKIEVIFMISSWWMMII